MEEVRSLFRFLVGFSRFLSLFACESLYQWKYKPQIENAERIQRVITDKPSTLFINELYVLIYRLGFMNKKVWKICKLRRTRQYCCVSFIFMWANEDHFFYQVSSNSLEEMIATKRAEKRVCMQLYSLQIDIFLSSKFISYQWKVFLVICLVHYCKTTSYIFN